MGYPKNYMAFQDGTAEAVTSLSAAHLNQRLKAKQDSRQLAYLQQALTLWGGYRGNMTGIYSDGFAKALDEQWSGAWASEPSGKYAKDKAGNYPLAFFKDMINGDGGLGDDAPPVVA